MAESQISRIKAAEEAARQLIAQADEIRKIARSVADRDVQDEMLQIAQNWEAEARRIAEGLRGMREDLQ